MMHERQIEIFAFTLRRESEDVTDHYLPVSYYKFVLHQYVVLNPIVILKVTYTQFYSNYSENR
jgi:hypothetical protein